MRTALSLSAHAAKLKWGSLALIMALAFFTFSYKLGARDFREDEYQVTEAAAGYLFSGDYYRWSWLEDRILTPERDESEDLYYKRAWPHTLLIAKTYQLFGISEATSRLPSVVFSWLLVLLCFFFTRYFTGQASLGLLASFSLALCPSIISLAQYARMYALLAPLFMLSVWLLYLGISLRAPQGCRRLLPAPVLPYLDFHYGYLILTLILLVFTYLIHINSLILLPATYAFVFFRFLRDRDRRDATLLTAGAAVLALLATAYHFQWGNEQIQWMLQEIRQWLSFFSARHYVYLDYLTRFPFSSPVASLLLVTGLLLSLFNQNDPVHQRCLFLYFLVGTTLVFFIFIATWRTYPNYTSHVMPLALILILHSLFSLSRHFVPHKIRVGLYGLFIFWIIFLFSKSTPAIYGDRHFLGKFSQAYAIILERFKPGKDVLFGQYLHSYYLDKLPAEATVIDMLSFEQYSLEEFLAEFQKAPSGFITWESRKGFHLRKEIKDYIAAHCLHLSGEGVNDTHVEIYYFDHGAGQVA